jgi:hypothetical protein
MLRNKETDDGSTDVRVIERQAGRDDEHFTEGEPDLEAPEELAVLEVDEEALLEEDLDSRADFEDEVDEDVLEVSLDHLVHDGDEDEQDDGVDAATAPSVAVSLTAPEDPGGGSGEAADLEDLEIEDLEDRVESLDRILRQKLAGDEEAVDDPEDPELDADSSDGRAEVAVASCGPGEFVCRSCFLVRSRALRWEESGSLCRDCVS